MTRYPRPTLRLPIALLLPITLVACGKPDTDQQDLNSLDAELTNGTARDPALTAALGQQIIDRKSVV